MSEYACFTAGLTVGAMVGAGVGIAVGAVGAFVVLLWKRTETLQEPEQ